MVAGTMNAMDPNAFADLQRLARMDNSPETLRAAAKQFEALFLQMVLKSMRDATPDNALFDSEQTRTFQQLHDQQIAMNMSQSGSGIGLADAIFRQLGGVAQENAARSNTTTGPDGRQYFDLAGVPVRAAISAVKSREPENLAGQAAALAAKTDPAAASSGEAVGPTASIPERVRGFVGKVWQHARDAGQALGVPASFVIAQAALESGWGRAELRLPDGSPSYNLFNIKAGPNWKGPVVELPVTEYANGRSYTENAKFRAYDSYAEAFGDYVGLLQNSPRYRKVIGQSDAAAFANSLQDAGYATDPQYADKLVRVIGGSSLRAALGS